MAAEHYTPERYQTPEEQPYRHPVITQLQRCSGVISVYNEVYREEVLTPDIGRNEYGGLSEEAYKKRRSLASFSWGIFAQEIARIDSFSLNPEDIIDIWTSADKLMPDEIHKNAFARALTAGYAIQGIKNNKDRWATLPLRYVKADITETPILPFSVLEDKEGLIHAMKNVHEINEALREFNGYIYNTKTPGLHLIAKAARVAITDGQDKKYGPKDITEDVDRRIISGTSYLISRQEKRENEFLQNIRTEMGHAVMPLYMRLQQQLVTLERKELTKNKLDTRLNMKSFFADLKKREFNQES